MLSMKDLNQAKSTFIEFRLQEAAQIFRMHFKQRQE